MLCSGKINGGVTTQQQHQTNARENVMHAYLPSIYLIPYSISSIGEARIPQFYQESNKQEHDRQEHDRTLDREESRTLDSGLTEHWTMPSRSTLY